MDLIEIQCGNCEQAMALSLEHLGTQVHCPHCQAIVQTPSREDIPVSSDEPDESTAPETAPEPDPISRPEEGESIFAEKERDDLFDHELPSPSLEMPDAPSREEGPEPEPEPNPVRSKDRQPTALAARAIREDTPSPSRGRKVPPRGPVADLGLEDDVSATRAPLPVRNRSLLLPTLLILLVPYSLATTGIIIFLLIQRQNVADPMERLPDPDPAPKDKKGPPREITRQSHDAELPPHLITTLRKPIRIGDIEVTPLEVSRTPEGDLALRLRMKNLSGRHAFVPVSESFVKVSDRPEVAKPYTFLHVQDKDKSHRAYGGKITYRLPDGARDWAGGELLPGQEGILELKTLETVREDRVRRLRDAGRLLWRVQVRRGPVEVRGRPVSATAVIGVDFHAKDIQIES